MRLRTFTWLLLFLLGGSSVQGQWIPVSSKVREVHETWRNGKLEKVENKEGVFYRSSDGSTLEYWTRVNGDESRGGQGEMTDNARLVQYSLNMRTKTAHEMGKLPERLTPSDVAPSNPPKESLGDQILEGIQCHRIPAFVQWPDGRRESVGENCVSLQYALELRKDHKVTQDGVTRHVLKELYDIKLGVEPDPSLFDLQKNGVTVYIQQSLEVQPRP